MYSQPKQLAHELISQEEWYILKVILPGKVLAGTESQACDLIFCDFSYTFVTGFCHFHGSIRSGPFQVTSTLGDCYSAAASKLSGTQSRLSHCLNTLKEFADHLLGLHATKLGLMLLCVKSPF